MTLIFPGHACVTTQAPSDLTLSVSPLTTTSISVSYGPGTYANYFEERHGAAGSGIWTDPAVVVDTISGLADGTSYDVQVRGVNGVAVGNWSATATGSTYSTPGTISDLVVTTVDASSVSLAYTPSTSATSHEYQIKVTGGSYGSATPLSSNTLTGLSASTDYTVHIRGVNAAATGSYSNEDNAVTDASGSIGNITDLVVAQVSSSQLSLTYTNASGATTHEYRYAPRIPQKTGSAPGTVAANIPTGLWSVPATHSGNITVPFSGHEYDVQVRGAVGATKGEWSNTHNASTSATGGNCTGVAGATTTGNNYTDSMLCGYPSGTTSAYWAFSGSPKVITYSFPQAGSNYGSPYSANENTTGFAGFTTLMANAVRRVLFMYQMFINVTFEEITESDSTHAVLRYGQSSLPSTAWAYYPKALTSSQGGDVWCGTSHGWYTNPVEGNYGFLTLIHETGHTLGLKHPHEAFGTSYPVMNTDKDALEYEVMSYFSYVGGGAGSGYTVEGWGYPQSPMIYDINALQYLYGERTDMVTDDTTYTFSSTTGRMSINGVAWPAPGGNRVLRTIWDSAGTDTINLTTGGYVAGDATISTTAGGFSILKNAQRSTMAAGHLAQGNLYNPLDTSATIEGSSLP